MGGHDEDDGGFDPTLEAFARFIVETTIDDIPPAVLERERAHVLDTIGCMLYGSTTDWVRSVFDTVDRLGGPVADEPDVGASLVGTARRVPPGRAALANGTAAHAMDFDDHCQEAGVHAGSATVPTALAYAEQTAEPVPGHRLLEATVIGTEIGIRSGFAVGYGSVGRGWHIAGWTGAFAAAATLASLRDLSVDTTAHALAVSGTQGAGLLGAQYGAGVKRFHMGKAAESGYLAAMLSEAGLTGDRRIFGSRYGSIGPTMSDDHDAEIARAAIGDRYRLLDKLSFKPFPSVGQVHAPVDALSAILERERLDPGAVEAVEVRVPRTVKDHVGWAYEPTDVMAAQANIQYAIAVRLVDGAVTVDAYRPEAIDRPAVLERIDDVTVRADDEALEATSFGAIVTVTADGTTYRHGVETPRGYPDNPMAPDELEAKFRDQAERVIGVENANRLLDRIDRLETLPDAAVLVEPCRVEGPTHG